MTNMNEAVEALRRSTYSRELAEDLQSALHAEAWLRMLVFLHELKDATEAASGDNVRGAIAAKIDEKIANVKAMVTRNNDLFKAVGVTTAADLKRQGLI
jgi:hypothetical protein